MLVIAKRARMGRTWMFTRLTLHRTPFNQLFVRERFDMFRSHFLIALLATIAGSVALNAQASRTLGSLDPLLNANNQPFNVAQARQQTAYTPAELGISGAASITEIWVYGADIRPTGGLY